MIIAIGWIASFLVTISEHQNGNPILLAIQAFPAALIVGLLAWSFSNKSQQLSLFARPVCWTLIVIGVLGFGRGYGGSRDGGYSHEMATFDGLASMAGAMIATGLLGLWLRSRRGSDRSEEAGG